MKDYGVKMPKVKAGAKIGKAGKAKMPKVPRPPRLGKMMNPKKTSGIKVKG